MPVFARRRRHDAAQFHGTVPGDPSWISFTQPRSWRHVRFRLEPKGDGEGLRIIDRVLVCCGPEDGVRVGFFKPFDQMELIAVLVNRPYPSLRQSLSAQLRAREAVLAWEQSCHPRSPQLTTMPQMPWRRSIPTCRCFGGGTYATKNSRSENWALTALPACGLTKSNGIIWRRGGDSNPR